MRKIYKRKPREVRLDEDRNPDGNPIFSTTFSELMWNGIPVSPLQKGYSFTVEKGEGAEKISSFSILITVEKLIQGGMYWVDCDSPELIDRRDYADFSVVDKDGVVTNPETGNSFFQDFGLEPGVDILSLQSVIETSRIRKGNPNNMYHHAPLSNVNDAAAAFPGIYFHTTIHSWSDIDYEFYQELVTYEI